MEAVNEYIYRKLTRCPRFKDYLDELVAAREASEAYLNVTF
ncbi:MAG: hypothetical protein ACR2JZ_01220 [Candidatus Limnocylindrales bacterium]